MTLARVRHIALLCAGILFCYCAVATLLIEKTSFSFYWLNQGILASATIVLTYTSGQLNGPTIRTLRFGKYIPATIAYWGLSAFCTWDISSHLEYTSSRGGLAGHNPSANLFVGCALTTIVLLIVITGWMQIRRYLYRVDTSA